MTRYRKAVLTLLFSFLLLALGCQNSQKTQTLHPTMRIGMDGSNGIPSCFASMGWVTIPSNGTVDWTAGPKDSNSYEVQFPTNPYPLVDSSGTPVTTPIVVNKSGTQSGTNKGPFTISPGAIYNCKANGDASACYFSYDIKYQDQSCVQHYGGGGYGVYSSGVHIDR